LRAQAAVPVARQHLQRGVGRDGRVRGAVRLPEPAVPARAGRRAEARVREAVPLLRPVLRLRAHHVRARLLRGARRGAALGAVGGDALAGPLRARRVGVRGGRRPQVAHAAPLARALRQPGRRALLPRHLGARQAALPHAPAPGRRGYSMELGWAWAWAQPAPSQAS